MSNLSTHNTKNERLSLRNIIAVVSLSMLCLYSSIYSHSLFQYETASIEMNMDFDTEESKQETDSEPILEQQIFMTRNVLQEVGTQEIGSIAFNTDQILESIVLGQLDPPPEV